MLLCFLHACALSSFYAQDHLASGNNLVDTSSFHTYVRIMDLKVDALGLLCPLPVLRLRKRMEPLPDGALVALIADDPAAIVDVPHFCQEAGHEFLGMEENDGQLSFTVRKGG